MSNLGCVVARSFPSQWPLASTTTEKFDDRVPLGLRSCSSEGCTTYRQVKLPSCRCIGMFTGSLSRRISCMQTSPGRGLPHGRGLARSAMRCSYLSSWSTLRSSTRARRQHTSCRLMGISCGALRCTYWSQGISTSTDFSLQIVDNAVSRQTMRSRSRGAVAVRQLPVDLHFGLGVPGFQRVIGTLWVHFFQTPTALLRVSGRRSGKSSLWNTRQ